MRKYFVGLRCWATFSNRHGGAKNRTSLRKMSRRAAQRTYRIDKDATASGHVPR